MLTLLPTDLGCCSSRCVAEKKLQDIAPLQSSFKDLRCDSYWSDMKLCPHHSESHPFVGVLKEEGVCGMKALFVCVPL